MSYVRSLLHSIGALTLALGSLSSPAAAQIGTNTSLPVPVPERPFLLVDAERRFTPTENAQLRVQIRDGGRAQISVFRLRRPERMLGQAGRRQGLHTADLTIGEEAERLFAMSDPLPRRGTELTLVREATIELTDPAGARRVGNEVAVYDSNEDVEDGVATYWVRTGSWAVQRASLGRLEPGLYLAQVRTGPWMASALVSVGEIVLLARRGDSHSTLRVTDASGAPKRDVAVEAWVGERRVGVARTDAHGLARLPASSAHVERFIAKDGSDVAWTDVGHVQQAPCDPRIYLATGRPVYRRSETMFLRGQVRGCDQGRFAPLPNRNVTVEAGGTTHEATSDRDGNFVVQVPAAQTFVARLDGREHGRDVTIDHRGLPERALFVEADRPFAAAGDRVRVRVADEDGGWPRRADVVLDTPSGRFVGSVGPGAPAVFDVPVPARVDTAERMSFHASLTEVSRVTMGSAEIWVGRSPVALELTGANEIGVRDTAYALEVRATDLAGGEVNGDVALALYGSDGNRAVGPARAEATASLASGQGRAALRLSGAGPWWIEARRGRSRAHAVVWERPRPPALRADADLGVLVPSPYARPGESAMVDVKLPGRGRGWLTLEQGDVLYSTSVSGAGIHHVRVPIDERARGRASVVVTYVAAGRVRVASSALEVETSRPIAVTVATDRATYPRAATAHVHIEAKHDDETPSDAVATLWLADAGYWELGEETYPSATEYFALPARPASGGDSTRPIAFGAEEGRRVDAELLFDGQSMPASTHRHAWGYGGELVRVARRGSLAEVIQALARAARLAGADVDCPDDTDVHSLVVHDLPWDLAALRLADTAGASAWIEEDRLHFDCTSGAGSGMGGLVGRGAGAPSIRTGNASIATPREERLEGTLHFVGLLRLGPDGALDLDVPLPDHPGRWRVEVLAIADDGGGARGSRVVHTRQPLEAWLHAPRTLRRGDRASLELGVRAPSAAGLPVEIALRLPPELVSDTPPPTSLTLDRSGQGSLRIPVRAVGEGTPRIELGVTALGPSGTPLSDTMRATVDVEPMVTEQDLRYDASIGPAAAEVEIPIPTLAQPARIRVSMHADAEHAAAEVLDALLQPRWDVSFARADRLGSLLALDRALASIDGGGAMLLRARIGNAVASELAQLGSLRSSGDEVAFLGHVDMDATLTALEAVGATSGPRDGSWDATRAAVRSRLARRELHGADAARALALLGAGMSRADVERALSESDAEIGDDLEGLAYLVRASRALGDRMRGERAGDRLDAALERELTLRPTAPCSAARFWVCGGRRTQSGAMARAALTLLEAQHRGARPLATRVASWISRQPLVPNRYAYGSDEADVLELFARLAPHRGGHADRFEVLLDGRPARARGDTIAIPAGAHRVSLRFAERPTRFRRLAVSGRIAIEPPRSSIGNATLTRSFRREDGAWELDAELVLPSLAHDVTLVLPLGAGLTADRSRIEERDVSFVGDAIRIRWPTLRPGRHVVRIPLVAVGPGTYHAASAHLVDGDGSTWAVTPLDRVEIAP
ncbi:MAG: alpha-2-macroglobulin family protein [Sandaracinaceae bacterium]